MQTTQPMSEMGKIIRELAQAQAQRIIMVCKVIAVNKICDKK